MPSSIGHALGGVAAAWLVDLVPGRRAWRTAQPLAPWLDRAGGRLTVVCAVLAATPDVDLLFHTHRTVTHSVSATVVVGLCGAAVASTCRRPALRVAAMCVAAYGSHLLLDWMGTDHFFPYGIQLLWPFSQGWLISGWDVFAQTERRQFFTRLALRHNLESVLQEIAILGPVLLALWLVRVKALAGFSPELTGRDHPPE